MTYLQSVNLPLFHAINGFCGWSSFLDRVVAILDYSELKGLVLVGTFGALWFHPGKDQLRVRRTLLLTLFSVALAILVARILAFSLPFEVRPMFTPDIGYREPLISNREFNYEGWSAFPSDQAAMMFALAAGFWYAYRPAGILVAAFSLVALIARIYLGIHYPVDVFVGALIGISAAVLLIFTHVLDKFTTLILGAEKRFPSFFYGALLAVLCEAGTMFSATRRIGAAVIHVVTGHYG